MRLNKLFPCLVFIFVLMPAGLFFLRAQDKPANASKPSQSGGQNQPSQPQGDVLMPLPDDQQPPNADKGAAPATANQPTGANAAPSQSPDANADKAPAPAAPNQPSDTVQVPSGSSAQGQAPAGESGGVYVFRTQVEEVSLHATVVDEHNRLVTSLGRADFTVLENGQPQQITSFRHEDIPVALGIVIDNSGSMRDKRPAVNQAALNLVKASNPNDEVFVVNFNDEYYLDQDFTSSVPKLQEALEQIDTRGGTALYDAVLASAEHIKKNARLEKRVLLVVTDGEDTASVDSLEKTLRGLQVENGPTIYTIGILDQDSGHYAKSEARHARRALQEIAEDTGGVSFFPKNLSEVDSISRQVAHDIRSQYTLGYKPSTPRSAGGYRTIRVTAHAKGYNKLQVRTRSGYYAGQERAAK
jgi:VWFA-related protein